MSVDWGGGSGPASRERWVPLLMSDSPAPVTANSGAPGPQVSGSGNSLTALPTTERCRQVGARSPPGCCASSLLTCFGIFFPKSLWVKGGRWEGGRGEPHCPLRLRGPAAAPFVGLSQSVQWFHSRIHLGVFSVFAQNAWRFRPSAPAPSSSVQIRTA